MHATSPLNKTICLIEEGAPDTALLSLLQSSGCAVQVGSVEPYPKDSGSRLCVLSAATWSDRLMDMLAERVGEGAVSDTILCVGGMGDVEWRRLLSVSPPPVVVARNDGVFHPRDMENAVAKTLSGDVFGLERYFHRASTLLRMGLCTSAQKAAAVERVAVEVTRLHHGSRHVDVLGAAAEELLSNAFFHGPSDASGTSLYGHLDRRHVINLDAGSEVELTLCTDGQRVGVSVVDPFGALVPGNVSRKLERHLRRSPGSISNGPGGAGLGLVLVFEGASHLMFNVEPGRCTEAIVIVELQGGYRRAASLRKSLGFFSTTVAGASPLIQAGDASALS